MAARQKLLEQQAEAEQAFANAMSSLVNNMFEKSRSDPDLVEIRNKFVMAKNEGRLLLERVGAYLWMYREQIKSRSDTFLMGGNYEEEIKSGVAGKSGMPDSSQVEYIKRIIGKLRVIYGSCNALERSQMWTLITQMLSQFAAHANCEKELEKLKAKR
jgi:hypothetical protein